MTDYTVAVLEDAIHLLGILRDHPDGLTLAQATKLSGTIKNKTFRLLYTLEKHKLVRRDEHGLYHLGSGLIDLGVHAQNERVLLDVSRPVMDRLVVETGESIFLGVISGSDALCMAARESAHSVRLFAQVGRRAPLHSGGGPKVLFAFMPEPERAALIERFAASEQPPFTREACEERLAQIRKDGYAIVVDELDQGAVSVAAPIYNQLGQVIAAMSIAGPTNRFNPERIVGYVDVILDATGTISRSLGYEVISSPVHGVELSGLF